MVRAADCLAVSSGLPVRDESRTSAQEAGGFEAILSGMRDRTADDDQLREGMSAVLDSLYTSFRSRTTLASG